MSVFDDAMTPRSGGTVIPHVVLIALLSACASVEGTWLVRAQVTLHGQPCRVPNIEWQLDATYWHDYASEGCDDGEPHTIYGDDGSCWHLSAICNNSGQDRDPFFLDSNGDPNEQSWVCNDDTLCDEPSELPDDYPLSATVE